jgi:hypothetical protein
MGNTSGNAYALTILSPIKNGHMGETSYADETFKRCMSIRLHEDSPLAKVPDTYLARLFVLGDVIYEATPGSDYVVSFNDILSIIWGGFRLRALPRKDHLKSRYVVFSSNFHGDLDTYLRNMWRNWKYVDFFGEQRDVRHVWEHCVAFDQVQSEDDFVGYMKKCQLEATLFFNGSTDDSLQEQLKSLYLKQEFAKFAVENQGKSAVDLQAAYKEFMKRVKPTDLSAPTWRPGQSTL